MTAVRRGLEEALREQKLLDLKGVRERRLMVGDTINQPK